ncbi:MAG TPA: deoxyribodipyrimidine photo-lyase [Bacteroidales bacterium]|nr:deoxyribodipyrimidine photo-lyase [Bacteroidales bacterium]
MVQKERITLINNKSYKSGPVIWWISRDQRILDNWALLYAQELTKNNHPVFAVFSLVNNFPGATYRHYDFMLQGLKELNNTLKEYNIPFYLVQGNPGDTIPAFAEKMKAAAVVTDFDPLRIKRNWIKIVGEQMRIPLYEVDTHNIVPCRIASDKQEYGAYTIRPKINRRLREFLIKPPLPEIQPLSVMKDYQMPEWEKIMSNLQVDHSVGSVNWIRPGEKSALRMMNDFIGQNLREYSNCKNDPNKRVLSNLSPYLHFGQISSQRITMEILKEHEKEPSTDAFLEELIIRKELSDNFCFYNPQYDSFDGFPKWAKITLDQHRKDEREYTYTLEEFELQQTHDPLWNAAQKEMVDAGKMHGYMRMYWAKKILEWSDSPETALKICIYLNDKYELDGRDPNGYAGCAWSVGGVHDRAWNEHPVYGKIRYMNYTGCKRKFDVVNYIESINGSSLTIF